MLESLKNFGRSAWRTGKRWVAPSIVSGLKLTSAIGSGLFTLPKFLKYVTGKAKHPLLIPASITIIALKAAVVASSSIPATFRKFQPKDKQDVKDDLTLHGFDDSDSTGEPLLLADNIDATPLSDLPIDLTIDHEDTEDLEADVGMFDQEELESLLGQHTEDEPLEPSTLMLLLRYSLKSFGLSSGIFSTLSSYLGAITFNEFISEHIFGAEIDPNNPDDQTKLHVVQSLALFFAAANLIVYYSFKYSTLSKNVDELTDPNTKRGPNDRKFKIALGCTIAGTMTTPFIAYFSTMHGLLRLPLIKFGNSTRKIFSVLSGVSSLITTALTTGPALLEKLRGETVVRHDRSCFDKVMTPAMTCIYAANGVTDAMSGFVGSEKTIGDLIPHIDTKNPAVIAPMAIAATANASLRAAFMLFKGWGKTINHHYDSRNETETTTEHGRQVLSQLDRLLDVEDDTSRHNFRL